MSQASSVWLYVASQGKICWNCCFKMFEKNGVYSNFSIYEIWNQELSFDKMNTSLQTFGMFEIDENDRMNKTEQKMYYHVAPASQYQLWNAEPLMLVLVENVYTI